MNSVKHVTLSRNSPVPFLSMADPRVSQSSSHSRWKQWWRRSPNTCCSKKILLLLVWCLLFVVSLNIFALSAFQLFGKTGILLASQCFPFCFALLIGWLADGRYEMIKFGSLVSFPASILYYFAAINYFYTEQCALLCCSSYHQFLVTMQPCFPS